MDYSYLEKMMDWGNKVYEDILKGVLNESNNLGNAVIDIPFAKRLDEELEAIAEGVNMDNMGDEKIGRKKSIKIREVLVNNLGCKFTEIM